MPLTDLQLKCIDILVDDPEIKWERLADILGVQSKTIRNWRKLAEFEAEIGRRSRDIADGQLFKLVRKGDVRALQIFIDRFGMKEKPGTDNPYAAFFKDVTPELIEDLIKDLLEHYAKGQRRTSGNSTPGT